jgi:hypothetical protein
MRISTVVAAAPLWKRACDQRLIARSLGPDSPLRMALPDTRCPRVEVRAVSTRCSQNEHSDDVQTSKRLFYKGFAGQHELTSQFQLGGL